MGPRCSMSVKFRKKKLPVTMPEAYSTVSKNFMTIEWMVLVSYKGHTYIHTLIYMYIDYCASWRQGISHILRCHQYKVWVNEVQQLKTEKMANLYAVRDCIMFNMFEDVGFSKEWFNRRHNIRQLNKDGSKKCL